MSLQVEILRSEAGHHHSPNDGWPVDASPELCDLNCRNSSKAHGCELPYSMRYSEAITSTTKGRGAITKGLNHAFRIHLANDWLYLFFSIRRELARDLSFYPNAVRARMMPRRRKSSYTDVNPDFRTGPSHQSPTVTAKEPRVQRRGGE